VSLINKLDENKKTAAIAAVFWYFEKSKISIFLM